MPGHPRCEFNRGFEGEQEAGICLGLCNAPLCSMRACTHIKKRGLASGKSPGVEYTRCGNSPMPNIGFASHCKTHSGMMAGKGRALLHDLSWLDDRKRALIRLEHICGGHASNMTARLRSWLDGWYRGGPAQARGPFIAAELPARVRQQNGCVWESQSQDDDTPPSVQIESARCRRHLGAKTQLPEVLHRQRNLLAVQGHH